MIDRAGPRRRPRYLATAGADRSDRHGSQPDSLEARDICSGHVTGLCPVEAEHGSVRGGDAVGVLVDEELVVSSVDRVVQDASCSRISMFSISQQWPVQGKRVADLRGHGVADAFFLAALGDGTGSQDRRARS